MKKKKERKGPPVRKRKLCSVDERVKGRVNIIN